MPVAETEQEQVLKFPDAATAFMWAEEILSRTSVESQIMRMMRTQSGYGELTRDEIYDLALTIAGTVERIAPAGMKFAYKHIYGREDNYVIQSFVAHLASHVRTYCTEASGKHHLMLVRLAHSVAEGTRKYWLYGRPQSKASVARDVGVHRQRFSESGWPELLLFTRHAINAWMDEADSQVRDALSAKGMIA